MPYHAPPRLQRHTGSYATLIDIIDSESSFDVLVVAGDLTTHGTPDQATEVVTKLKSYGKPVLVVAGNMDPPGLDDLFVTLGVSINGRGVVVGDVGFFGVSASPFSPMNTPNEISEEEIWKRSEADLSAIQSCSVKVYVPHCPPHNTKLDRVYSGQHVGSISVRAIIEKHQPDLVICGHIHEAHGIDRIGRTQIINCGPVAAGHYCAFDVGESIQISPRRWGT